MTTSTDFQPTDLDRLQWFKQGYRVFCNICWWIGADNNYDECPECGSDLLEWILECENKGTVYQKLTSKTGKTALMDYVRKQEYH